MTRTTGVVVAHGTLASALVEAAEGISGIEDALHPVSNDGLRPDQLVVTVETHIGDSPAVIFTDLLSGSCTFAGRAVSRKRGEVVVVTGVSLPMLVDFLFNRDPVRIRTSMFLGWLAPARIVSTGRQHNAAVLYPCPHIRHFIRVIIPL